MKYCTILPLLLLSIGESLLPSAMGQSQSELEYCSLEDSGDDCALDGFNNTKTTIVLPGGETRCYLNTTGSGEDNPYGFQVVPGRSDDSNKLLIHFQGGGACDSFESCAEGVGAQRTPQPVRSGIFSRTDDRNPYKDWTVVAILYCSGDVHIGENSSPDGIVQFTGRKNTLSALEWAYANIPNPDRVVVTGSSAGGVGNSVWSYTIAKHYSSLDTPPPMAFALTAAIPRYEESADTAAKDFYKICSQEDFDWTNELYEDCIAGNLTIPAIQLAAQKEHRDAPFATIMYKHDTNSLGRRKTSQAVDYGAMKEVTRSYVDAAPSELENNAISYFLNGKGHGMIIGNKVYTDRNGDAYGDTLLGLMTDLATYTNETIIRSSCQPLCTLFGSRSRDYGCDEVLAAATFNGPSSTCKKFFGRCRKDSDCCSKRCGLFGFCRGNGLAAFYRP